MLDLSKETFRRFAQRHRYDLILDTTIEDDGGHDHLHGRRRARWRKVDLLARALPHYDLVVWVDADAMICRFDRDVAEDIGDDCFQGLVLEQWPTRFNPNSGVWVMRRDEEATRFLDRVRAIGQQHHSWADQAAVCVALGWSLGNEHGHGARPVHQSSFLRRTAWLPPEWNPLGLAARWPGRVRHFAHLDGTTRLKRMARELGRIEARETDRSEAPNDGPAHLRLCPRAPD